MAIRKSFGKDTNINKNIFSKSAENSIVRINKGMAIRRYFGNENPTRSIENSIVLINKSMAIRRYFGKRKYICLPSRTLREKHCQGRNFGEVGEEEKTLLLCSLLVSLHWTLFQ